MRVLIVKLSSMGDLIHALPALTDALEANPNIEFDWVVDEAFAEIPQLHPAVRRIIKSAHRRWGKAKWQAIRSGELWRFLRDLRKERYDIVLDAQNNMKSAIITRCTRGLRYGMDKNSVREFGVHLAYQKHIALPTFKEEHAVTRQRLLFAQALGYPMPTTPANFMIDTTKLPTLDFTMPRPYLMFIHNTTWDSKHWPERYWVELIKHATDAGYAVALPWGNRNEQARAKRLATVSPHAILLPDLSITQKASVIFGAEGIVTVDTGLAHLTAAMDKPGLHLYGPTDVGLLGIQRPSQKFVSADYPCAPCYLRSCKLAKEPLCFVAQLPPDKVWGYLQEHLKAVG